MTFFDEKYSSNTNGKLPQTQYKRTDQNEVKLETKKKKIKIKIKWKKQNIVLLK